MCGDGDGETLLLLLLMMESMPMPRQQRQRRMTTNAVPDRRWGRLQLGRVCQPSWCVGEDEGEGGASMRVVVGQGQVEERAFVRVVVVRWPHDVSMVSFPFFYFHVEFDRWIWILPDSRSRLYSLSLERRDYDREV